MTELPFNAAPDLMDKKAHLTKEGLEELRQIKNKMNTKTPRGFS